MRVLLDTCVVSELRRSDGDPRARAAVNAIPDNDLFLSVLTIGEIVKGIALLEPGKKQQALQEWADGLQTRFADHILPVDLATCVLWGEIIAQARRQGITVPAVDGLIAATARRHGLRLMTRNVADFAATGAVVLNPWQES
jgi:predicted nucleic acid-binding protein